MFKLGLVALPLVALSSGLAGAAEVPYPAGYRDWHHVKSMVIGPGHGLYEAFGGIHHIYANAQAKAGYASGKFADGAVIVFDLLDTKSADGAIEEAGRKVVGVMHKDSKQYAATGGWGFEGFGAGDPNTRAITQAKAATACFECHLARRENDYVFSAARPWSQAPGNHQRAFETARWPC
ncbi:MAG: cytochrome C [Alphaproteobacteria bacterium]|nr:cytochrome C [Alphaproteobacteria bacterium]